MYRLKCDYDIRIDSQDNGLTTCYRHQCQNGFILHNLPYSFQVNWSCNVHNMDFEFFPITVSIFDPWWRHEMETFSALLALCEGNSPATVEFPAQRPVTRSFDVFFVPRLNKRLSKQYRRRDLSRFGAHYDVTVMLWWALKPTPKPKLECVKMMSREPQIITIFISTLYDKNWTGYGNFKICDLIFNLVTSSAMSWVRYT